MVDEELKKEASQDRRILIRLASTLPAGDGMRRAILAGLRRRAAKEPWKHWGKTQKEMLGIAKAEMKRLNVRSPDDLRKARKKHKPSLPSDGSSGQYDAWTETLAQVLEMEE